MNVIAEQYRQRINHHYLTDETQVIHQLIENSQLSENDRRCISENAAKLVSAIRNESSPSMMETFLAEYGLSTKEGIALMCLAEALLRVPDTTTIDALIEDKIATGNWQEHLGQSASSLVNSSTWALLMTGKLLKEDEEQSIGSTLKGMTKRLGEPLIRAAIAQAMKELGRQFVLGRNIEEAAKRANKLEEQGYRYSYDMLGEAARTEADALRYYDAYSHAIHALTPSCNSKDIRNNPGISVKLSALHARYEVSQKARVMDELVARTLALALQAKKANMGFNIDAEEAERLTLSLDVIEAVLSHEELQGWDGFGVVVQAFGQRAVPVLDWLYATADRLDRRIMVRLVKGAYWDTEIKRAQVLGLEGFPVFTRKINTDLSYLCCAEKLLTMTDRIYPQFATHNAHSVASVLYMAKKMAINDFEFQRLHGMGESLHDNVLNSHQTRCRIYAPVGAHQDLLAYLVRRLLENGANSSFVNQIADTSISPEQTAQDPFTQILNIKGSLANPVIIRPQNIFGAARINAKGWDITDTSTLLELEAQQAPFKTKQWQAKPMIAGDITSKECINIINPAQSEELVGQVIETNPIDIETAIKVASAGFHRWQQTPTSQRAACLRRVAELLEKNAPELFSLACREAGKTLLDAIGEIREAVDFARYYANEIETQGNTQARGIITCISPWNFPLAIFSGQVLAAIAAGNSVLAKPAEQTPLIAARAVELMHDAGIPRDVIQLLPGTGLEVGVPLSSDSRISGVCFTGSTQTAQSINRAMAKNMRPDAPLVAETGGMNAMIVDSTALPEQVVRDVVASAFQSAGQRCSALRILYVQEDIADTVLTMLYGAMDELRIGDPWQLSTDIGPVIDKKAQQNIIKHCEKYAAKGHVLKTLSPCSNGTFVAPTLIKVTGIEELQEEVFGPVLHIASFAAKDLDKVINSINSKGYGLTFGLHTRVDHRIEQITKKIAVGNTYVNRNQIGAVVGSQPFGGEGLSGTGPKAGGPHYLKRFTQSKCSHEGNAFSGELIKTPTLNKMLSLLETEQWRKEKKREARLQPIFDKVLQELETINHKPQTMPGPTGELNLLSQHERGVILCLGPDQESAYRQAAAALMQGNSVVIIAQGISELLKQCEEYKLPVQGCTGQLEASALIEASGFSAVCCNADQSSLKTIRTALAKRDGALLPLITEWDQAERFVIERHLCIDTTAAGGNASLIASTN